MWCYKGIPRHDKINQCGLLETFLQDTEGTSVHSFEVDNALHDVNDAAEAMHYNQSVLRLMEAPEGLHLGPPRVPERLLIPLRHAEHLEGVTLDKDYYLQPFMR